MRRVWQLLSEPGGHMKPLQPAVHAPSQAGGHLLHQLHQLLSGQTMEQACVDVPEGFGFADQPRPAAHGLPAPHPLLHLIGVGAGRRLIHSRRMAAAGE